MHDVRRVRKEIINYLSILAGQPVERSSEEPPIYEKYDAATGTIHFSQSVHGIRGDNRNIVEGMRAGQPVKLKFTEDETIVSTADGRKIGHISSYVCNQLAILVGAGEAQVIDPKASFVKPLSQRPPRSKVPLLHISFDVKLKEETQHHLKTHGDGCILCCLGGDHQRIWAQKLEVMHLSLPLEQAKLVFELYNRIHDEYLNPQEPGYAGLDDLDKEILAARKKMQASMVKGLSYKAPDADEEDIFNFGEVALGMIRRDYSRYGSIEGLIDAEDFSPLETLTRYKDDEAVYCWWDMSRMLESEYDRHYTGSSHWYDIMELYAPGKMPFDLKDQDIVSIFGFDKFEAFADLSYGC